jgi:hypothetical protein
MEIASAIPTSADQRLRLIHLFFKLVRFAGEQGDGKTVEPGALETCHTENVVRDCVTN